MFVGERERIEEREREKEKEERSKLWLEFEEIFKNKKKTGEKLQPDLAPRFPPRSLQQLEQLL